MLGACQRRYHNSTNIDNELANNYHSIFLKNDWFGHYLFRKSRSAKHIFHVQKSIEPGYYYAFVELSIEYFDLIST